ncbi:3TM-type holin [Psychromonas sp. MME2]|uniref:3TM-type holin n=1 Tax=unclassified Psychromonas TaxID=2614957 RepID=UPI00339CBA61
MWDNIKNIIGSSAPLIGTLIGGPAGAAVGGMVASALGCDNTPEAIEQSLKSNPDALIILKKLELDNQIQLKNLAFKHAELESDERKHALQQQHVTMQAELASHDAYVRRWRPTFGYAMCLAWCLVFFGLTYAMVFHPEKAADLVNSVVALTPLFGIALSVLGISIHKRSLDKQVAAGIQPVGILQGIKQAIVKTGTQGDISK